MPKRKIAFANHYYYHLLNRGIDKRITFTHKTDYQRYLKTLWFYQHQQPHLKLSNLLKLTVNAQEKTNKQLKSLSKTVAIAAFTIMPNHFHILAKQITENGIQTFMSNSQNSYTRYFNTKYDRSGPLFNTQFKAVKINNDQQLLHISRYIHLNPYTNSIVKSINKLKIYPWSSLPEYFNPQNKTFLISNPNLILSFFSSSTTYFNFISDQADYQRKLHLIKDLTFHF